MEMWVEVIIQDLGGEQPNFCDDFPKHFAQTDRISTSSFWMALAPTAWCFLHHCCPLQELMAGIKVR
jgi:predicted oxidoreductase (fatty acid repression mutant protein)